MKRITVLLTLLLSFAIIPVSAKSSSLASIDISCQIDKEGTGHIVEVWKMSAYEGTEVFKTFSNMNDQSVVLESVQEGQTQYRRVNDWDSDLSREEKKNTFGLTQDDDTYEICIGIGDYGQKTYTMRYQVKKLVNQYRDTQGINYAFMGDMGLNPKSVKVDIYSALGDFKASNTKIWGFGYEGRCDFLDNGHIRMTTNGKIDRVQLLAKIEGKYTHPSTFHDEEDFQDVQDDAMEGADFDEEESNVVYDENGDYSSEDEGSGFLIASAIGFFALVGAIFLVILGLAQKYEDKELLFEDGTRFDKKEVHPFRDLPTKSILYFYYLAQKGKIIGDESRSNLMSAFVLKWIRDNQVRFIKGKQTGVFFKKDNYEIDFTMDLTNYEDECEKDLYDMFVSASGRNRILETKEFERWSANHYEEVRHFFTHVLIVVKKKLKNNGHFKEDTIENTFLGLDMPKVKEVCSLKVKEDMEHVYGLYKFLVDEDNMKDKQVIDVHLWEEYLIFATILGIADKVEKQLKIIHPHFEEEVNLRYYDTMYITRAFLYSSMQRADYAYHEAHSANSGGSFFGGGGGSSFGGGGGGFSGGGGGGIR